MCQRECASALLRPGCSGLVFLLWLTASVHGTWRTGLYKTHSAAAHLNQDHTAVYHRRSTCCLGGSTNTANTVFMNTLRTPVYTTSMRRNAMGVGLVFEADLFTTKHISHWVLQGVCLCLNSD
ncbi:unnamed protein product [Merluccius merluccius]